MICRTERPPEHEIRGALRTCGPIDAAALRGKRRGKAHRGWGGHACLPALMGLFLSLACPFRGNGQVPRSSAVLSLITNRPPNILLILADDLGYADLGAYGQTKIQTPHLDELAAEGLRLTHAYAGSPQGAASRCTLFTGLHTGHARIRGDREVPLTTHDITLAQFLLEARYSTCLLGEWGLGREHTTGTPHQHGFQEWLGFLTLEHGQEHYPEALWRTSTFNKMFDYVLPLDGNADGQRAIYAPNYLTMAATNYIRGHRFEPFFLTVSYNLPRVNLRTFQEQAEGLETPSEDPYQQRPWSPNHKQRAAMITRLDRLVGQLLQTLSHYHLETNTIVLFTSDNGPAREGGSDPSFFNSTGPFRGGKNDLTEGGLRVPFIVRWPGRVHSGQVSDVPFAFWDLFPTVAEAAGLNPPPGLDGISLWPSWTQQTQTNEHDYFYWETHGMNFRQAARINHWKGMREGTHGAVQLYQLNADPLEETDVSGSYPEVVQQFIEVFQNARADSADWPLVLNQQR